MLIDHDIFIEELPPDLTPDKLPSFLFDLPHFLLFESSLPGEKARYSIAAWDPVVTLELKNSDPDFLKNLRHSLAENKRTRHPSLPFTGGWMGYLGYEAYPLTQNKVPPRTPELCPQGWFGYYDQFYFYDHWEKRACFVSLRGPDGSQGRGNLPEILHSQGDRHALRARDDKRVSQGSEINSLSHFLQSNFEKVAYLDAINKIKNLINQGDCYQVNLAQRFTSPISSSPYDLYKNLRKESPAPFSAFLNLGDTQILSSSPESFLNVDGQEVITRPIKGTRPRSQTPESDLQFQHELKKSSKDHAELLMITDLERNDLGRVCVPGSIQVTQLREIESFAQVHHQVSTIEGTLSPDKDVIDLLQATFPGGSITGAPKIRAMQIIHDLEPHPRNVYCGAIGYFSCDGQAQFNIAIRTMVLKDKQAYFWSGGGIVSDSNPESEYGETLVKAKGLMQALQISD